jgi:hypothetical protein
MIQAVIEKVEGNPGVRTATWAGLTTTDRDGSWLYLPGYPDKTVEVWGVFTTAAAVQIEGIGGYGSLLPPTGLHPPGDEGVESVNLEYGPIKLNDSRGEGNVAVSGAKNCFVLNENPLAIRPYLTSGDGDTLVNVRITCTARQV